MKDYVYIHNAYKCDFIHTEDGAEMISFGNPLPLLIAYDLDDNIVRLTENELGKTIYDNIDKFTRSDCEFICPCFSFTKGNETKLAKRISRLKYAFAYLDNVFKYYDKNKKKWRAIRYDFEENKEIEKAFKLLAESGSFVLGLDKLSIEWYFYTNDVLTN